MIDAFCYNGEKDLLRLRLEILNEHVDTFLICEAKTTFSGNKKPLYFFRDQRLFKKWWPKIEHYVIDEDYTVEEVQQAYQSELTKGDGHWKREYLQKESVKKGLKKLNLSDDTRMYIGDVDEIWTPYTNTEPARLKLRVYTYYLNNRSSEEFWGTFTALWGQIKDGCLNQMKADALKTSDYHGSHFTSMGGIEEVRRKLRDSYSENTYNRKHVTDWLETNMALNRDFLGRNFTYTKSEEDWPQFLKENRVKYKHLCR